MHLNNTNKNGKGNVEYMYYYQTGRPASGFETKTGQRNRSNCKVIRISRNGYEALIVIIVEDWEKL